MKHRLNSTSQRYAAMLLRKQCHVVYNGNPKRMGFYDSVTIMSNRSNLGTFSTPRVAYLNLFNPWTRKQ